jgi:hypothetical protein
LLTSSANRFLVFLTRALPIDRCMHVVQTDHESIATDANRLPLHAPSQGQIFVW